MSIQPSRSRAGGPPPPEPRGAALPWDEQAERAVLGSILLDPDKLDDALEILKADDFFRETHRLVFQAFVALSRRQEPIDLVTVKAELERAGQLERIGGPAFLASLFDGLSRATNTAAYATIVHDKSLLRRVLDVADALKEQASSASRPARELLDLAERRLFDLSQEGHRGGLVPLEQIGAAVLDKLDELAKRRENVTGIPTGYGDLDQMLAGFQDGDLIVLAARPSMGKTALALNIAQNCALSHGTAVGFFSLEMSAEQLFLRLLCGLAEVRADVVRRGKMSDPEWDDLIAAHQRLTSTRIFIDDTPAITPMEMRSKARRLRARGELDLIVVDYLQLMRADERAENRQQEISEISRSLKGIAKELGVPVLALSQLSRAPEQRTGKPRPQLSDLRESGAIEQDADVVLFIYRPEVYVKEPEKVAELDLEGKAEIIVAKQRNGPTGNVELRFVKQYTRFENVYRGPGEDRHAGATPP